MVSFTKRSHIFLFTKRIVHKIPDFQYEQCHVFYNFFYLYCKFHSTYSKLRHQTMKFLILLVVKNMGKFRKKSPQKVAMVVDERWFFERLTEN